MILIYADFGGLQLWNAERSSDKSLRLRSFITFLPRNSEGLLNSFHMTEVGIQSRKIGAFRFHDLFSWDLFVFTIVYQKN